MVMSGLRLRDMLCDGHRHGGTICGERTSPGGRRGLAPEATTWQAGGLSGVRVVSSVEEDTAGPRASATAPGSTLIGVPGLQKTSLPAPKGIAEILLRLC